MSDIGLCLETGHMMLGGGDPVAMLRDWGDRVNHVPPEGRRARPSWPGSSPTARPRPRSGPARRSCELGHGDLDVDAILGRPAGTISFGGWLVVEQDILPAARSGSRGRPRNSGTTAPFSPNEGCDMPPSFRLGLIGAGRMGPHPPARPLVARERVAVTAIAELIGAGRAGRGAPARRCLPRHRGRCWTAQRSTAC